MTMTVILNEKKWSSYNKLLWLKTDKLYSLHRQSFVSSIEGNIEADVHSDCSDSFYSVMN